MQNNTAPRYFPLQYTIMISFLVLIISVLTAMSLFTFNDVKNDMQETYVLLQKQTEASILKTIGVAEAGYTLLENFYGTEMQKGFARFIEAYETSGRNPARMDLEALKQELGGKMDLYLINAEGIVEHTTYSTDLGMDFKQFPAFFQKLTVIREGDVFVNDGLKTEARTGKFRMYAFMPTPDHRYLLEFGLIHEAFAAFLGDLDISLITKRLQTLNPALLRARIFGPNGNLLGEPGYKADAATRAALETVFREKTPYTLREPDKSREIRYIYTNLRSRNALSDRNKVIELTYSTRLIEDSLEKKSAVYFIISALAISLSLSSTFLLAGWVTGPIKRIVESIDIIAQGDLNHPIQEVQVKNELKLLKQSIIIMVRNMRDYIERIDRQNTELKELDKLKDDFLSNTSHELKTPVNGIVGIAGSMIDGATGMLPQKALDNLTMIVYSGRRLSNLINDILDFSKLKHNNLVLQTMSVELKVLTDIVLTLSAPLIEKRDIQLINRIPHGLAAKADENRLQQILHNLIGNAIKFTEAGSVTVTAETAGTHIRLAVADTGVGIPPAKIAHIFNPFEQADGSVAREFGGTGLGLSISKQLVELHGGTISVESEPGQGTCVAITLPLAPAADTPLAATSGLPMLQKLMAAVDGTDEKTASSLPHDEKNLTILIVDDDPVNLQVLENQLYLENYNVQRACDGEQALAAVRDGTSFATILLDLMMPKMSGFEVCRIIRENYYSASELPIIILTAKNQVADLVEGLQAGANDYLTKPFAKNELLMRMKTHIQLARITIAYSHFVPHEFLRLLNKESILDVSLGEHVQKYMTVLFVDIRAFTTLSEQMNPRQNFSFINTYLGRVSPVIREHHGFIDKYIGDAIMALFPRNADDAVQAAIEIHKQLEPFNRERRQNSQESVEIGIGLHTGRLMLGTIGEEKRMEGTVISDAVNLASRLEGLTKVYGAQIIVSAESLQELEDSKHYHWRFLGKVRVKGKNQSVKIFEIIDADPPAVMARKLALQADFDEGVGHYYAKHFEQAEKKFRQVLAAHKEDKAAALYLERSHFYRRHQPPPDWDGVEMPRV